MSDGLGNPEWISCARSFMLSLRGTGTNEALALLAPEVTYRVLGHHTLSGEFSGRDEVARHLATIMNQTDGRVDPVKFEDWMLGLSHVSVLVDVEVGVGSAIGLLQHLILMRFGAKSLIDQVTVFFSDPDEAERLYGQFFRDPKAAQGG